MAVGISVLVARMVGVGVLEGLGVDVGGFNASLVASAHRVSLSASGR